MSARNKKIRVVFRIFLVLLWIGVAFFSAEFYLHYQHDEWLENSKVLQETKRKNAFFTEAYHNNLWAKKWWEYKKNMVLFFEKDGINFQIRTNAQGFRDDDVREKKANELRIVCVGGSTTVEGQTNATTYPNLVEKRLQKHRVDVINCGISGLLSSGEYQKLPVYLSLKPDILMEYNGVNDICRVLVRNWEKDYSSLAKWLHGSLVLKMIFQPSLMPSQKKIDEDIDKVMITNLKKIWQQAKAHNVKMVFCSLAYPDLQKSSTEEIAYLNYNLNAFWRAKYLSIHDYCRVVENYNEQLEKFCNKNNILFIPVAKNLRGSTNYFVDICHLTPEGIEQKSKIIAKHLIEYIEQKK
ncbi:SGNH/GDSL hydrolase family protein [Candidatus Uabimicrobium amorphum]|uniref:SGNH hydrolase-type esterase domain-containing protein n=1 Tax=Uabimicrobium amorphum TaxID=2596890 RepID=A0A5S9IK21_UABAM|nr:SGNH/GDSL hydrolase family protein [Candidatus Uabimicrobium amorphum]BBM83293.1 hypothetical protein UABAM_01644 [Candidatus Uabimicrobium amorphum]